ncbi:hypothetical protein ACTJJ0_11185 [Chitinophaga sp. 22321]|uniref:hypothetical protein n=1 Tax=Chitinophaga sp. 22321 TaxID=3453909 RepID=UPI003F872A9E
MNEEQKESFKREVINYIKKHLPEIKKSVMQGGIKGFALAALTHYDKSTIQYKKKDLNLSTDQKREFYKIAEKFYLEDES